MPWKVGVTNCQQVHAVFSGYLRGHEGVLSAQQVVEALANCGGQADVLLEVEAMTGYDRDARLAWQRILYQQRRNIESVVLIGGNAAVRMGARVLTSVLGTPLIVTLEVPNSAPPVSEAHRLQESLQGTTEPTQRGRLII